MVDRELDELKREFLSEAEGKVREMQTALDVGRNSDSLQRLGYLAHQLKGSGGSYGYQRISADAAEIEKAIETVSNSGLDPFLSNPFRYTNEIGTSAPSGAFAKIRSELYCDAS